MLRLCYMPGACGHLLYPSCGCPAPAASEPAPATPELTHVGPAPRKRGRPHKVVAAAVAAVVAAATPSITRAALTEPDPAPELEVTWVPPPMPIRDKDLLERAFDGEVNDEDIALLVELADRDAARLSLAEYCKQAWKIVEPSTTLVWNWHHELICNVLQALFESWRRGKHDESYFPPVLNAALNVCPGSLKSRLCSVFFPTFCWLHEPGMKFICLSVNEEATLRDARASRELIRHDWYVGFGLEWRLKGDQDAVSNYANTFGGERLSRASGSEIVGLRGDCFAGHTRISTEDGDVPIAELHARVQARTHVPRVWSFNTKTQKPELRRIRAARRISQKPTIALNTSDGRVVQCTPDHRIWSNTNQNWTQAAHVAGHDVSIVRGADQQVPRRTDDVLEVQVRGPDVRELHDDVSAHVRGVREACASRSDDGTVLLEAVQDAPHAGTGDNAAVRNLRAAFSYERAQDTRDLFVRVRGDLVGVEAFAPTAQLPAVQRVVRTEESEDAVLQAQLCESGAFDADDRNRQLALHGRAECVRSDVVATAVTDSRARQPHVSGLRSDNEYDLSRDAGASHRREPNTQRAAESDHALRLVPHHAPQVARATVSSVDCPTVHGRAVVVDVYDIDVEGLHSFFAEGVWVHNCLLIDDANNPNEAEIKTEREKVNALWDTNIYNRVNDGSKSLRIGIQQRTHSEDWTGHVLKRNGSWSPTERFGWLHVVLPAEFETDRRFVMPQPLVDVLHQTFGTLDGIVTADPRQVEGESVHPERFSKDYLAGERRRWEGTGNYACQMQQRPALAEGSRIKRAYWNFFRLDKGVRDDIDDVSNGTIGRPRPAHCHAGESQLIPAARGRIGSWDFDWVVLSLDCAAKKTERGSNWGMLAMAGRQGRRYILDDRTRRGDIIEIVEVLRDMIRTWRPDKVLIEDKAAGEDLRLRLMGEMLKGDMPLVTLETVKVPNNTGKEERLDSCIHVLANGFVSLLDGAEWMERLVEECAVFPNGSRDDRVDCISQCLNHYAQIDEDGGELPDW